MDYQYIDNRSLRLMIELQFEDLKLLDKGKQSVTQPTSDNQLAMSLYKNELERLESTMGDQAVCGILSEPVSADVIAIATHNQVGLQSRLDLRQAFNLTEQRETTAPVAGPSTGLLIQTTDAKRTTSSEKLTPTHNTVSLADLQRLRQMPQRGTLTLPITVEKNKDKTTLTGESAKSSAEHKGSGKKGSSVYNCLACCEAIPYNDITYSPCGHSYCKGCLVDLFESSMTNESLFPPKCCSKHISFALNKKFFSESLCKRFQEKSVEFATADKTYCHNKACSAFISPEVILADRATCRKCYNSTCSRCKGQSHLGACPEDPTTQEILRIAKENGWQRCYSCHRMVELASGCHHMTCICKAQFCYVCGNKWKSCQCKQWDEDRLLERAQRIANRNTGLRVINPGHSWARRVERERANLRRNHQCQHDSWVYRGGRNNCEECHDTLPNFIYECGRCRVMACRRCRYNRL